MLCCEGLHIYVVERYAYLYMYTLLHYVQALPL